MIRKFAVLATLLLPAALFLASCATQPKAPPASASAPAVPIPPPPPRGEPNLFSNMSGDRLRVLLGTPAFIRKDGATEMWRYDTKNCRAFFFLYGAGAQAQIRHIETMPQGKISAADPACLASLKKTS